jgi:DNA polymerase-3 subunit gamma/tau
MSYIVLARQYRPKNFAQMVGQEHVVTALENSLTTQRLHHAYLFTGTRGVGKTTVSRILAKSLNCVGVDGTATGVTATPCGVCHACQDIDTGRFVDYTELDAASNRGVDEVQALLEQAVYKPVQGRFKVFMIDEVHMLTNTAFNAMLKTLEEPPEYLKFVLATTDPQKVPVTVLSRCLQFNLRPMAPQTIVDHLGKVLANEQVASDPQALHLLAKAARGSMRDALSLADQAIAFGSGALHETTVRQMLGVVDSAHVLSLIDALAQSNGAHVVQMVQQLRLQGIGAASTLEEMMDVLQRMAVCQLAPLAVDVKDPLAADIQRLAQLLPPDQTQLLYSLCLHGRADLGLAPDEYAALVMILLRLVAFQPQKKSLNTAPADAAKPNAPASASTFASIAPVLAPIAKAEVKVEVKAEAAAAPMPVQESPPPPPLPSAQQPLVADAHAVAHWFDVVQALVQADSIHALVRELALQSQCQQCTEAGAWHLQVENSALNHTGSIEKLLQALQQAGHAVKQLHVTVGAVADSPSRRLQQLAQQWQQQATQDVMADPFIQAINAQFGGKMVPGSLQKTGVSSV